MSVEVSWFSALCDDDYEFLGVEDPTLKSSWEHCRDIVLTADRNGFDNVLLPSGYTLGIDSTAFACRASIQTTGSPRASSSCHNQVAVGPVSKPTRLISAPYCSMKS